MTLELDHGTRTPPHGDALAVPSRHLEFTYVEVPVLPELAEVRMELDVGAYLGLDTPSRIRANLKAAQDVAELWGIPVVLDPTLEPGQWRLEVEPRSQR